MYEVYFSNANQNINTLEKIKAQENNKMLLTVECSKYSVYVPRTFNELPGYMNLGAIPPSDSDSKGTLLASRTMIERSGQ